MPLRQQRRPFGSTDRPDLVGRCIGVLAEKTGIYGMIGGQTVDVELTGKPIPAEKLDFIYRLKTGALLECALMIGAILGGADDAQVRIMEQVASDVGLAFQIRDDILDVTSTSEVLGKPVGSDEKNEKTTYVTLEGLEQAENEVDRYSNRAVENLKSLPVSNPFLEELLLTLIAQGKIESEGSEPICCMIRANSVIRRIQRLLIRARDPGTGTVKSASF